MDIQKISKLHKELTMGISTDEMSSKELLAWAASLLTQYRQSKTIIRNLSPDDSPQELEHWETIRQHTYVAIDEVLTEIYQRSLIDLEDFGPGLSIKFADITAKIRAACWDEIRKDRSHHKEETEEVSLILE